MKTIATEAAERSIQAEDALRLVIDTTPALIHILDDPTDISITSISAGWSSWGCPWKRYAVGGGPVQFTPKM